MTHDRHASLLDQDWGDRWESLPEAPPLQEGGRKDAQLTLRLSPSVVARLKTVADLRTLPYHSLARAWILDSLATNSLPDAATTDEAQSNQLNLKIDREALQELKDRAHELRRPYHRLAREWLEDAIAREERSLGIEHRTRQLPATSDLMVLLLHAKNERGQDRVRGITRLQKLLFVIEQQLSTDRRFYAFNYGPFDEGVNDAADALRLAGFLEGSSANAGPPSFTEMLSTVVERSGPRDEPGVREFALNSRGHAAAASLRTASRSYEALFRAIEKLRAEWDTGDLIERVYETWPEYAEKSLIREKVGRRSRGRRSG